MLFFQRANQQTLPICHFEIPVTALNLDQLLMKGVLLVPEMYVAAMKPVEFKHYLRNVRFFYTVRSKVIKIEFTLLYRYST